MKKLALSLLLVNLLAACATTKPASAPVVDKSAAASQSESQSANDNGSSNAAPAAPVAAAAVDPLHDPNNILSQRSVYFDYDKYNVKDEYRPLLEAHAKYLEDHLNRHVTLEGNTDERGSAEYNLALGEKRAEAVRNVLMALGVNSSQMETISYGKERPKATGHDEAAWKQNRRTDIRYDGE